RGSGRDRGEQRREKGEVTVHDSGPWFYPTPGRTALNRDSRNCSHSSIPCPVFADTSKTGIPGRTDWMLRCAAAASNSTAAARSILVMRATSAVLKIVGYFSGLSSPSVTENST